MHGEPILRFERVRVTVRMIWRADMSFSPFFLLTDASDCCSLGFLAASICDNLLIQNRLYLGNSLLSIRPKYRYNNTFKLPPFFDSFYVFSDFQRRTSDPFGHFISATDSYFLLLSMLLCTIIMGCRLRKK